MFKAAYQDEFYLALRNALHAEVDSWRNSASSPAGGVDFIPLWKRVFALEQTSRNSEATTFEHLETQGTDQLVHLQAAQQAR
jgi:hypothetical protein